MIFRGGFIMNEINWKEGDIFHWSWNDEMLDTEHCKLQSQSGTLYWCCSRIGVVKGDRLVDTYWYSDSSSNKTFSKDYIQENMELVFIANQDDLVKADPSERMYYLDEDCVDLNHPNNTSGNFYIRKGAKKNLDKMKRIVQRDITRMRKEIEYELRQIERQELLLQEGLTEEDVLYVDRRKTDLWDNSYYDER